MIKYNNNTINDWNFGDDNIIKVYRNNAVCYYKITTSGGTSGQTPCFAVVDDISQYSDTEFEDVFNKDDGKWYKRNNLNNYEQYGVYGSGRTITYYDGKLTIDEETSSRLPVGYTEVEYIQNTGTSYINTNIQLCSATTNTFQVEAKVIANRIGSNTYQNIFCCMSEAGEPYQGFSYRFFQSSISPVFIPSNDGSFAQVSNEDGTTSVTASSLNGLTYSHTYPLTICCGLDSNRNPFRYTNTKVYSFKVTLNDEIVADYIPAKRDNDSKYGLYDLITDTFYSSPNGNNFVGGSEVSPTLQTYEYIYSGNSWVNVGEVSGSSRVPTGYVEVEYIENTSIAFINTGFKPNQNTDIYLTTQCVTSTNGGRHIGAGGYEGANAIQFDYETGAQGTLHISWGGNAGWTTYSSCVGDYNKHTYAWLGSGTFVRDSGTSEEFSATASYGNYQCTDNLGIFTRYQNGSGGGNTECFRGKLFDFKMYDNGTLIRDLVPCKRNSDSKYGAYDVVNDVFYPSANSVELTGGSEYSPTEYPIYYAEMQDPPDNLVFSSMTEAESYVCPWVGMRATIDGDKYVFSGDSQSGYEWVYNPSRLPVGYTEVEYVENTGTSYLDIAFKPNTNTRILTEMQAVSSANYPRLFGAGSWNAAGGINLAYQSDGGSNCLHINWYGRTSWSYYTSFTFDYDKHTYDLNKNSLYRDETLVGSTSYTTSYQSTDNLGVFTYISGGRPSSSSYWGQEHFKGKMFSFKVYDNGTLVRDLVPCIKDSDDTVGAYDIVNDVFYTVPTGYTTDKLIAGNPI